MSTPNFGKDTITDFHDHTTFSSFAAVLAHAAQVGNDVTITASAADVLTLKNVKLTGLQSGDFQYGWPRSGA
jgi:hypothetical protein